MSFIRRFRAVLQHKALSQRRSAVETAVHTRRSAGTGITPGALRWKLKSGIWQPAGRGAYIAGGDPPTPIERALACVVVTGGVASGSLAGVLYELDNVTLRKPFVTLATASERTSASIRALSEIVTVDGYRCTGGLQTVIDLAASLDDIVWEQVLESAIRKKLVTVGEIETEFARLGAVRVSGVARMRRVLKQRPPGVPATESLLETLMVQLIATDPTLPTPECQVEVRDATRCLSPGSISSCPGCS